MMKKILSISLALMMIAALVFTVSFSASATTGSFIFDEKEALAPSEFDELEETAQGICNSTGVSVCYLLTDDLGGKTAQERAEELATSSTATPNALILVDSYDRSDYDVYLFAFGMATMYTSHSEEMLDAYKSDDTYVGAARKYLNTAQSILTGESANASANASDLGAADGQLIVDSADLLSQSQEAALGATAAQISEKHNISVVIVTVPSTDGKTAKLYADDYYDYHGYKPDGVLLLITLDNGAGKREAAITTTGKCEKTLTDSEVDKIFDDIMPDISSLNWNKAFELFLTDTDYYISPHVAWYWIPLSLLIGFIIALIIMFAVKSKLKSVKMQAGAKDYVRPGSMVVTASRDTFLYHTITRTAKPKNNSSSGGSFGSSGTHHGGSSRTF